MLPKAFGICFTFFWVKSLKKTTSSTKNRVKDSDWKNPDLMQLHSTADQTRKGSRSNSDFNWRTLPRWVAPQMRERRQRLLTFNLPFCLCLVCHCRGTRSNRSPPSTARPSPPSSWFSPWCPSCASWPCCWPPPWSTASATAPTTSWRRSSPTWEPTRPGMLPPPTR